MDYFKNIKLNLEEYPEKLENLSKINIFVGANNSGKSRFIREIFSQKMRFNTIYSLKIYGLYKSIGDLQYDKFDSRLDSINADSLNIFNSYSNIEIFSKIKDLEDYHNSIKRDVNNYLRGGHSRIYPNGIKTKDLAVLIDNKIKDLDELFSNLNNSVKFVYIPILRGLRPINRIDYNDDNDLTKLKTLHDDKFDHWDLYRARTIFDYFNKTKSADEKSTFFLDNYPNCEIFTGLTLYNDIKKKLLGNKTDRNFIKDYEAFLKKYFFNNREIELIPRLDYDVLNIKIGDEEERPIYSLGDGLQTILICTFPLFQYKTENLVLCVEEPELTLHPSMQRKLLDIFSNNIYSKNTQIFLTTHSNHLLDITLDYSNVSIYSFEKIADKFSIKNTTRNKDVLDLLGVRNSSVFLSNCVIWVEGISDRLYIKKYLKLYFESIGKIDVFEEDKHYSIIEYSGGNITHFNFFDIEDNSKIDVSAINKNNFIIADNDGYDPRNGELYLAGLKETKKKGKRLELLYNKLTNNFWAYHKEIEYLLPLELLNLTMETKYIADDFGHNLDLNGDNKLYVDKLKLIKNLKSEIGVANKKDYAVKKIKEIEAKKISFEKLPNITKELIKRIYNFIEQNNLK